MAQAMTRSFTTAWPDWGTFRLVHEPTYCFFFLPNNPVIEFTTV